jgi:carbamoyltransferase
MTAVLGISAFYHDSAAALVVDGAIVAAAQEERFTRKKHDPAFPLHAVEFCLEQAGLSADDLDFVAFYEKPFTKFERLLETYVAFAPAGFRSFCKAMPQWIKEKLHLRRSINKALGGRRKHTLVFPEHHESHAASAFFASPFDEAAILTLDGVGEWSTTTFGRGSGNRLELLGEIRFPHSLGLLYSAFTYYCGFKVNSGEYKLMGLAPYGRPVYRDAILEHLIDLKPDGSFWLNMDYFNYCQGLTMTNGRFHRLFGGPPRQPESQLEQRHMDLAASIQAVTEEAVLRMARHVYGVTGAKHLCLAGGVALNCVANGRLLREGPFDDLWIQPAAGDAGGALGAALFVWHQLLDQPRAPQGQDAQRGSLLGPAHSTAEIERFLDGVGAEYESYASEPELLSRVASLLAEGNVVGWFHGPMEFGPRALGARSILGDARNRQMQSVMNLKIKYRESFRPFAPVVMRQHAPEWFDLDPRHESPYMLLVTQVHERKRRRLDASDAATMGNDPNLLKRVNVVRSEVPAITHVDCSARVQTVDELRHPRFHRLMQAFYDQTGCPVLVNTSFNIRGEPIVCTPQNAYRCFLVTEMDALVLENVLLLKDRLACQVEASEREQHLAQFQLD